MGLELTGLVIGVVLITLERLGLSVYSVDGFSFWDDGFSLQEELGVAQGGGGC